MEITQITTPIIEHNGEKHSTMTVRFVNFNGVNNYIERVKKRGKTKLLIRSIYTLPKQTEIWLEFILI